MVSQPRLFVLVAILAVLATPAIAFTYDINTDPVNDTGGIVNDFHMTINHATSNIHVSATYKGSFPNAGISNNDTKTVTINWSGAQFNANATAHVGASWTPQDGTWISNAYWTFGGIQAGPPRPEPIAVFDHVGTDFTVIRAHQWSDISGTTLLGTSWYQGQGNLVGIVNQSGAGDAWVSYSSQNVGSTPVALDDLNATLAGFPSDGAIAKVSTTPIPTLTEWGLLILALTIMGIGALFILRRKRVSLAVV